MLRATCNKTVAGGKAKGTVERKNVGEAQRAVCWNKVHGDGRTGAIEDLMDYGFGRFFHLRYPQDLLGKLRRDYQRVLADPSDSCAAFDFFVTANHLPDWVWPSDRRAQRALRRTEPIPRVCEHLADGAKHFLLERDHTGVLELLPEHGGVGLDRVDDSCSPPLGLVVRLDQEEARAVGSEMVAVATLAAAVLKYWERRFGRG